MKVSIKTLAMFFMAATLGMTSCKDDDDDNGDGDFTVSSIEAAGVDLYGATSATDVPSDADIVITFNSDVDDSSLDDIMLMRGTNEVEFDASATGSMVTIDPTDNLATGTNYTLQIEGVKSTGGGTASNVSVDFTTEGIGAGTPPQSSAQTTYLQLNGNIEDLMGNATMGFAQNSWVEDRFGNANSAAYFNGANGPGTGDIIELTGTDFLHPSMTISTWFMIDDSDYPLGTTKMMFGSAFEKGYFFEMGDEGGKWVKMGTSHQVEPDPADHYFATAWGDNINGSGDVGGNTIYNYQGSIADLISSNEWHHLVMSYDASSSIKKVYLDGMLLTEYDLDNNTDPGAEYNMTDMAYAALDGAGEPVDSLETDLALGFNQVRANAATSWMKYKNSENTFVGAMDDFRIWNVALSETEVNTLFEAESAD